MPKNDTIAMFKTATTSRPADAGSDASIQPTMLIGEIEGVDEYDDSQDDIITLLEMHVYDLFFDGIDGEEMDEEDEDDNAVALPTSFTIDYNNKRVSAVRRNWREDDEMKKRRDWFVSYKFLPGLGFLRLWPVSHDRWAGQSGDRITSRPARQCAFAICRVGLSCVAVLLAVICKYPR